MTVAFSPPPDEWSAWLASPAGTPYPWPENEEREMAVRYEICRTPVNADYDPVVVPDGFLPIGWIDHRSTSLAQPSQVGWIVFVRGTAARRLAAQAGAEVPAEPKKGPVTCAE